VDADGREIHRKTTGEHHAALNGFDQLRRIAMARVVSARGVDYTHDRPLKRAIAIACAFNERFA